MTRLKLRWLLIVMCLALLCVAGWTAYGQKAKVSRQAWEYKLVIVPRGSDRAPIIMNENGADGWELIQARFPGNDGNDLALIFKRSK